MDGLFWLCSLWTKCAQQYLVQTGLGLSFLYNKTLFILGDRHPIKSTKIK